MTRHRVVMGATVLAGALLLAACGGPSYGGTTAQAPSAPSATSTTGETVHVGKSPVGTVLVDSGGKTLYAFAADSPGTSRCDGSCLQYWPPDSPPGAIDKAADVSAQLGTIRRDDGTKQLTVNGWPVYTYVGDSRPGQAAGQGIDLSGGRWWVLSPTGHQIRSTGSSEVGESY